MQLLPRGLGRGGGGGGGGGEKTAAPPDSQHFLPAPPPKPALQPKPQVRTTTCAFAIPSALWALSSALPVFPCSWAGPAPSVRSWTNRRAPAARCVEEIGRRIIRCRTSTSRTRRRFIASGRKPWPRCNTNRYQRRCLGNTATSAPEMYSAPEHERLIATFQNVHTQVKEAPLNGSVADYGLNYYYYYYYYIYLKGTM